MTFHHTANLLLLLLLLPGARPPGCPSGPPTSWPWPPGHPPPHAPPTYRAAPRGPEAAPRPWYAGLTQKYTVLSLVCGGLSVVLGGLFLAIYLTTVPTYLRAMFGLSVIGILVSIFSCMLVYQILSHEKKKQYLAELNSRCLGLYQRPDLPLSHHSGWSCPPACPGPWLQRPQGNLYSPTPEASASTLSTRSTA